MRAYEWPTYVCGVSLEEFGDAAGLSTLDLKGAERGDLTLTAALGCIGVCTRECAGSQRWHTCSSETNKIAPEDVATCRLTSSYAGELAIRRKKHLLQSIVWFYIMHPSLSKCTSCAFPSPAPLKAPANKYHQTSTMEIKAT